MMRKDYLIFLILVYLWMIMVQPQNRFPILGEIHFEKIVIVTSWLVLLIRDVGRIKTSSITPLILILYVVMFLSYLHSPYKDFFQADHWLRNYWKYLVFYFLVLFATDDLADLFYLFVGIVVILAVYQSHSWIDFLRGAYVWQAGMKRMVGVWSEGIGAANYYGMITLFSLPFAVFWFQITENKKLKISLVLYLIMSLLSILYSGTRGAMVGVLFFGLINIRRSQHIKVAAVLCVLFIILSISVVPDYLKNRYLTLIPVVAGENGETTDRVYEDQLKSAESRWTGLVDGWNLMKEEPIFGHGPGSSPLARKKVNDELRSNSEEDYQMHNLYGQLLGETGLLGSMLFFWIIIAYFSQLRGLRSFTGKDRNLNCYRVVLQNSMLLMLFYGFASHSLFRFYWFLLFACEGSLLDVCRRSLKGKQAGTI